MSKVTIKICDLCKVESRSDDNPKQHFDIYFGELCFDFKNHYNIQSKTEIYTCYKCAKELKNCLYKKICELSLKGEQK